jgi:hypothetical protein
MTPWMGDRPIARPLRTQVGTKRKTRDASMSHEGFEHPIPVFKEQKTVQDFVRAPTMIANGLQCSIGTLGYYDLMQYHDVLLHTETLSHYNRSSRRITFKIFFYRNGLFISNDFYVAIFSWAQTQKTRMVQYIQDVPDGKVNILGKKSEYIYIPYSKRLPR